MSQARSTVLLLGGLAAVAAGVGLYAWKGVYAADLAEAAEQDRQLQALPQGAASAPDGGQPRLDFTRVAVTTAGETSVLEKDPTGRWRLIAPIQAGADQAVVEALLSQLRGARLKAALDEHPDAATLARYGLDRPRFTVEAVAPDGVKRTLVGGADNTFDGSVFVRRDGQDQVYAAEGALRAAVARTTLELREKDAGAAP
jgi:hypothetical protein